jgi:hypothetical protein
MHRFRKANARSGRDTDNVAVESPVDPTVGLSTDEKAGQTIAGDVAHPSTRGTETDLKKFEVLHEFDPNLPGENYPLR